VRSTAPDAGTPTNNAQQLADALYCSVLLIALPNEGSFGSHLGRAVSDIAPQSRRRAAHHFELWASRQGIPLRGAGNMEVAGLGTPARS